MQANHALCELICEAIGDDWKRNLYKLGGLREASEDSAFQER